MPLLCNAPAVIGLNDYPFFCLLPDAWRPCSGLCPGKLQFSMHFKSRKFAPFALCLARSTCTHDSVLYRKRRQASPQIP